MPWDDVWTGDCVKLLDRLPEGSVDLVFADPPFNIGYEYDVYHDRRGEGRLPRLDRQVARRGRARVLKPTGSFCVAIGDEYAAEHQGPARRARADDAELDRLALHLRRELHEEVQPQPRPHLLLRRRPEALHVQRRRGPRAVGPA